MDDYDVDKQIHEFIDEFSTKHAKLLNLVASKYTIPNRYTSQDVVQYFLTSIIDKLKDRIGSSNPIEDWEKYFKSCLDYYGIEFQRMHGFLYCLPKRPRKSYEEIEKEAKERRFKYLVDITEDDLNCKAMQTEDKDPIEHGRTEVWDNIMSILTQEEADILECIYIKNMTWAETAVYMDMPQSTCWFRKKRAFEIIKDNISNIEPDIGKVLQKILRNDPESFDEYFGS